MRWIKRVLKFLVGLVVVLVIAAVGVFFYLSRPETLPDCPEVARTDAGLDSYVGEYELADGTRWLLTYGANGGGQLYALVNAQSKREHYLSRRFVSTGKDRFTWEPRGDAAERQVQFKRDAEDQLSFTWTDEDGQSHEAKRVDAGYLQQNIFWSNDDVSLSGTLFVPADVRAGAVMMHGSGDSDRDNLWYLQIGLHLVRDGVAVLLPDKRGTGRSAGQWRTASFEDFAKDALTGRTTMAYYIDLADSRIGLVGLSQGGAWVAPTATRLCKDLPFVVNVSGAAVSPNAQLAHEIRQNLRGAYFPAFLDFIAHPYAMGIPQRRRSVWWCTNGNYDPLVDWEATRVPTLVVYGSADEQDNVPVSESVARLEKAAARPDFQVRVFNGVGHGLVDPETFEIRPDFLAAVSDWALTHSAQEADPAG